MSVAPGTLSLALAEAPDDAAEVLTAAGRREAASAIQGGATLADALTRHAVLPPTLTAAFEAGAPDVVRPLVEAGERLRARAAQVRRTVRAALTSATLALAVMIGATWLILPSFYAQFAACEGRLPTVLQVGIEIFSMLSQPAMVLLLGALAIGGWLACEAIWLRLPGGRRAEAALIADTLAALIGAGVAVPDALTRASRAVTRSAPLTTAARAIEGGAPIGPTLARAGVIEGHHVGLLTLPDQDALPAVLAAVAAARRADQAANAASAGRAFWLVYALVIGGLAVLFAALIMTGSVAVLECLG